MGMGRKYIIILLLLLYGQSYAQNDAIRDGKSGPKVEKTNPTSVEQKAYMALIEKEAEKFLVLRDKRDSLKNVIESANKEIVALNKKYIKDSVAFESKKTALTTKRQEFKKSIVLELQKSEPELNSEIKRIESEIPNIDRNVDDINKQIVQIEKRIAALGPIKEEKYNDIISKHTSVLEGSFSSMSNIVLDEIIKECVVYSVDERVKSFMERAIKIREYKSAYDRANEQCSSKYDKVYVEKYIKVLSEIIDAPELKAPQKEELASIKAQLELYDDGVLVFQEFIKRLNEYRGVGLYNSTDYSDDKKYILDAVLQERVKQCIDPVVYLKREFAKYLKTIEKDPKKHPEIEQEIMGVEINNTIDVK